MKTLFANVFTEYKSPIVSNEYVKNTLMSLGEYDDLRLDFVIVDNTLDSRNYEELSTYYSKEYKVDKYNDIDLRIVEINLDGKKSTIVYARNNVNNGYGPGGNLGMKIAIEYLHSHCFIISNNDMECLDEKLDLMKVWDVFCKYPDVGVVGVNVKNLDESPQTPCRKVDFIDRWIIPELLYPFSNKFKKHNSMDLIRNPKDGVVYRVRGSFMFIRPEAFLKTGGFDENIFLYSEEPVLAERMCRSGYKVYHLNAIHMLHNHYMDNRTITNNVVKQIKQRFKSEMYYFETYRSVPHFLVVLARILFPQYHIRIKLKCLIKNLVRKCKNTVPN